MQHLKSLTVEDEKAIKQYLEKNIKQTGWNLHLPERGISVGKCFVASSPTETVLVRLGIDDRIIAILSNAEITPRHLGGGLTVSGQPFYVHGNILVARDAVYLTDWETLHLSDPVRDVAHLLWWMYPQSEWKDVLGVFGMDLADTDLKERFYLYVSTRALYVYLLFVNTSQEHLAKRFLKDAQRSSHYQGPEALLIT